MQRSLQRCVQRSKRSPNWSTTRVVTRSLGPIAAALKLDKSAASRRVSTAIAKGFVRNLEDRRGKPGRYVLGDAMPDDVVILPTLEQMLQALQCCSVSGGHTQPPSPYEDNDPGMDF